MVLPGMPRGVGVGGFQAGGAQPDFVESIDGRAFNSTGTTTINNVYLCLVRVGRPLTISTMGYYCNTASGNVALGIYTRSGTTYTLVASTPNTAAAGSAAMQTIALSAPFTMQPGVDYYLAFGVDNSTLSIGRFSPLASMAGNGGNVSKTAAYSSGLPVTISSPTASGFVPYIFASV